MSMVYTNLDLLVSPMIDPRTLFLDERFHPNLRAFTQTRDLQLLLLEHFEISKANFLLSSCASVQHSRSFHPALLFLSIIKILKIE
jgi:hypothetical protein